MSRKATKRSPRAAHARRRGRRGIDPADLVEAGLELLSRTGEQGFSVRKLAAACDVDPMTVLHHFGSREALVRAIADRALASLAIPPPSGDWRGDLIAVANAYRCVARRYPRVFHLHFRYNATGPADHASSEIVYRAMRATGLPDYVAAALGVSFFAFVLGFATAEVEGLLRPLDAREEQELAALDPLGYPATRAFVPAFKSLDAEVAFTDAFDALLAGIAALEKR